MGFGRKVEHSINSLLDEQVGPLRVADVSLPELESRVLLEPGKVLQISCVSQFVEDDDVVFGVAGEDIADEIGADETGTSRD
jgi:hypothetical protein